MKIAVVSSSVFAVGNGPGGLSGYGGLEVVAWQLAKGLGERGHEVYLFAPEGSSCPAATVVPIGPPGQWAEDKAYNSYWQHLLYFNGGGAVVDHSWQKHSYILKAEGRLSAPILGVTHAPVNTMYQELPPVENPCFVCISQDQALHFQGLFGREARVAYNGIDPEFYRPLDVPRRKRFLFLARFSSIKGADLAIKACKEAGVGLDLVGDTSITQEPEYFAACKALCDGEQIRMVGPCARGNTVWWFSQAHAMLHPNARFREPFGLAPVEAQACGCPVIAYDNGAMRETIRTKENPTGVVVRTEAALTEAVRQMSGPIKPEQRAACREWAVQFSIDRMVRTYESLCQEAVSTGGW